MSDGRPLMQMRLNWYCTTDIDADWELGDNGWRVQVAGDCRSMCGSGFRSRLKTMAR